MNGMGKKSSPSLSSSSSRSSSSSSSGGNSGNGSLPQPADESPANLNDGVDGTVAAGDVTDVDSTAVDQDIDGEMLDELFVEAMGQQEVNEEENERGKEVVTEEGRVEVMAEKEGVSQKVMEVRNNTRDRILNILIENSYEQHHQSPDESNISQFRAWTVRIEQLIFDAASSWDVYQVR